MNTTTPKAAFIERGSKATTKWTRMKGGGYVAIGHGRLGHTMRVDDNGGGKGPAKGAGRWAVMVDCGWVANVDTLDDAKALAIKTLDDNLREGRQSSSTD